MRPREDVGWLDIGLGKDMRFTIRDNGRLARILDSVIVQENKIPAFCAFLGGDAKDNAMKYIFPQNNIRRHRSRSSIGLRYDVGSLHSASPVIIADGDPQLSPRPNVSDVSGTDHSIMWEASSPRMVLWAIWARLIFLFADTVCIFADDFPELADVVDFLTGCMDMRSASTLPLPIRPRVIVVLSDDADDTLESALQRDRFYSQLQEAHDGLFANTFSSINLMHCGEKHLSEKARCERLRSLLFGQLKDMQAVRQDHRALFASSHWKGFFQSAVRHTANELHQPFNFIKATRASHPIPPNTSTCIAHYCQAAELAGIQFEELAPTIASALVMDHYVPGMLCKKYPVLGVLAP
ncbi:hypothetical protein CNMCM8927_003576 [Aspergillus lentulus]|uniref:Uncharacterized protein n=1 Tax=Aspergillus lentulus TaxID=293939 RepID=A0AAN5YSU9_ASPLE|nr:hypothetical protein CNMCM8927_003576 [Aspergillus lentulus]